MKSFNLTSKFNLKAVCFVCICSLFYINCETCENCLNNGLKCNGNGCSLACKPQFSKTSNLCISCSDSGYYSIDDSYSPNNCIACRGSKVIIDTQECIQQDSCGYLYSMENACYSTCPENSIAIGNECQCLYRYYIITILETSIKRKICLPPNTIPSGYIYYTIGSDELYKDSCRTPYNYIKNEIIGGKQVKRCSEECIGNEYILEKDGVTYCVDSCLNTQKIYIDGITRKCIDSCSSLNTASIEFLEKNNNCIKKEECTAFYGDKCYGSCSEKGYYKKYGSNECLIRCDETTSPFKYADEEQKICYDNIENCPFVNEAKNKCLSSCNIGQGFYIENDSEKICYTSCEYTSEHKFFNTGTNKCIGSCSSDNYLFHKSGGNECFSSCKDIGNGAYIYANENNECSLTSCAYYHYKLKDGVKICLSTSSSCDNTNNINFKYIKGNECIEECNGYQRIEDSSSTPIKCFDTLNECFETGTLYKYYNINERKCWQSIPDGYYINSDNNGKIEIVSTCENYYYENSYSELLCLNSCKEKNLFIDFDNNKICKDKCKKLETFYFYDPRNNKCLETCIGTDLEFAYQPNGDHEKCLRDCPDDKFYYENDKIIKEGCNNGHFRKSPSSKICVPNCQQNEIVNNGICINGCPSSAPYLGDNNICYILDQCNFINEEGNRCLTSCNNGEGFYIVPTSTSHDKKCYSSCSHTSNNHFHNFDSNICIQNCASNDNTKKYHLDGGYICYSSCLDIPPIGKYIYEIESTSNGIFICSENIPSNCEQYMTINGIKKCGTCETGYAYKKGKECLKDCDGYEVNKSGDTSSIKICVSNLNECFNYYTDEIFYNIDSRKCWDSLPVQYFIKSVNDNKYEVVNECQNYYYTENEKKYCINKCSDKDDFFINFNNEKECVHKCKDINGKYYFYDINKKCVKSCKEIPGFQYAENPESDHKPCQQFCPGGQFFNENYIILSQCQYFVSSSDSKYCSKHCETNEKIIEKNGVKYCVSSCPKYKVKVTQTISSENYEFEKCVSECDTYFLDITNRECISEEDCTNDKYYKVGNICYLICSENNHYIDPSDSYICKERCPSSLSKFELLTRDITDVYICKNSCNDDKYLLNGECIDKCPKNKNYIGYNNECKQTCNGDYLGPYYKFKEFVETNEYNIYECIKSCETLFKKENENECSTICPNGYKFIKENTNICLSECPEDFPFYKKIPLTNINPHYICKSTSTDLNCNNEEYILDGECKSANDCISAGKKYIYENNKICIEKCKDSEYKEKNIVSSLSDGIFKCINSCDNSKFIIGDNKNDLECISKCTKDKNYIGKDRKCKNKCEIEDGINYYQLDEGTEGSQSYTIYQCTDGCLSTFKYKVEGRNECYNSCPLEFPYLSESENICYNNCLNSKINPYTLITAVSGATVTEGKCENKCGEGKDYYGKDKVCKLKCISPDIYLKENEKECMSSCQSFEFKKKVLENENDENSPIRFYICVSSFGEQNYYFNDRILRNECNNGHYVVYDTHECVENCESISIKSSTEKHYYYKDSNGKNYCVRDCSLTEDKKFLKEDNHCSNECDQSGYYKYHKENDNICIKDCPVGFIKKETTCVQKCQGDYQYFYKDENGEKCLKICPGDNNYIVKTDEIKSCLHDCPKESPFYINKQETIGGVEYEIHECEGKCDFSYVVNIDKNINAKLCLSSNSCSSSSSSEGISYFSSENGIECYSRCPEGNYTLEKEEGGNTIKKCLEKCPSGYYHEKNKFKCLSPSECYPKAIDYDTGLCVESCENKNEGKITENSKEIKVCISSCKDYGLYETPDKKCVEKCEDYTDILYLKNGNNGKCTCKYLFYYDKPSIIKCLPQTISKCNQNNNEYNIELVGTNQCLSSCDYIISLNGEYCYTDYSTACRHDPNSVVNEKKCDCPYKYQIKDGKKQCYAKDDVCHSKLYVPYTKECVDSCPLDFSFKFHEKICLRTCPFNSKTDSNTCKCGEDGKGFWIEKSDGNYECLDGNCPDNYPVYSEATNQCLKTCKETNYPFLYENKCYLQCQDTNIINKNNIVEKEIINNNLGAKTCICRDPWYYENKVMKCPDSSETITSCLQYTSKNFKFMIYETKECVELCPSNKLYNFNNECFSSCESASLIYPYVIKVNSLYECQCKNLWYFHNGQNKNLCISLDIEECIEFKDPSLPSLKLEYEIFKTKQCVESKEKCPTKSYIFNYVCYDACPENTKDDENEECVCNTKMGYWYEYEKHDRKYLKCGLKECSDINNEGEYVRMYLLESESKCLKDCKEDGTFSWAFRNICVEECPEYTEKDNDNKNCLFLDLNNESKVKDLISLKNYANIQAKELYEKEAYLGGIHLGGYLFNKFDASLQIYAINKEDTLKELATKSNLTYIDFNTCLPKIYADNSIRDEDKIIVAKYDLKQWNLKEASTGTEPDNQSEKEKSEENKYLINRVEYEFFNSRTMEKIDASVCDPYEIIISYPIFFNKNKYNDYETGFNNNEYMKKFEIGKELFHKNNEVDTFNFNNSVYKDICIGIEIDGKDLVLEDRYEYLYPNGALLCESNCTINNTNFEEERINCKCSYKEIFDFYRKENEKNDLLNDPNFSKPGQSSANLEIIKCLSKLNLKQAIVNNEAFYYCAVVTLAITSMVFVTAFHGVKAVSSNIGNLLNKFGNNNINNLDINIKNENPIGTSNKVFNNPPKRTGNNITTDNDGNIVEIKNTAINKNINNNLEYNENDFNDDRNINLGSNNLINDINAEYLPSQYNFKYFKLTDKGIRKKIERSSLPFKVKPETKYLIERKNNINYPKNYLNGPFYKIKIF